MKFLAVPPQASDITGQKFGRLVALGPIERVTFPNGKSQLLWLCECDCGGSARVASSRLKNGHSSSCGCLRDDKTSARASIRNTKHGMARSAEYEVWAAMKGRCSATTGEMAQNYKERGIKVCKKWACSFEAFFADVGLRPSPQHSIDRYPDNDGDYEPDNVRWATREQQMRNKRCTIIVTAFGETKPLASWFPNGSKWPVYARCRSRIGSGWDHERVVLMGLLGR